MLTIPSTPFANADIHQGRAHTVVSGLTEEQCRYALWLTLVIGFGSPTCNFSEDILAHGLSEYLSVAEGQVLLAEIGVGVGSPEKVARLKKALEKKKQEN